MITFLSKFIWYLLLSKVVFEFITIFLKSNFYSKILGAINSDKLFFILSALAIFISFFWPYYYLGGDDSRIYYLYPAKMLQNFSLNTATNTGISGLVGFLPPYAILFTNILFYYVDLLTFNKINLQAVFFVLNIVLGITYFNKLVTYFLKAKNNHEKAVIRISAILYVFSIFLIYSVYSTQLLSQYIVSMYPLGLYYFFVSVRKKKYYLAFIPAIAWSIFAFYSISFPWFLAVLLTSMPLLSYIFWNNKKAFIISSIVLGLSSLILNFHWIIYLPHSATVIQRTVSSLGASVDSIEFRNGARDGIKSTAQLLSPFYTTLNIYSKNIQENFRWPSLSIFNTWYIYLLPFNLFFIYLITKAGSIVKSRKVKHFYIVSLSSFLISIFLFSVNIGSWGINLFTFLILKVPGFVSFRNMFDKFGISLALNLAILLCVSAIIVLRNKRQNKDLVIFLYLSIVILNIFPFLNGAFWELPIWTTKYTHQQVKQLNNDYLQLIDYAQTIEDEDKFAFLPLSWGNIDQIPSEENIHNVYSGVSPFLLLSGKNDFSGTMSFSMSGNDITKALSTHRYNEVALYFQKFNAKYLIKNNTVTPDLATSYIYSDGILIHQNEDFCKTILGNKIKSFGDYYDLHLISNQYNSNKFYLTDNFADIPTESEDVSYIKIDDDEFEIYINNFNPNNKFVFLESYNSAWKLVLDDYIIEQPSHILFNYANAWDLSEHNRLDEYNGKNVKLTLKFQPEIFSLQKSSSDPYLLIDEQIQVNTNQKIKGRQQILPYVSTMPGSIKHNLVVLPYERYQLATQQFDELFFADKRIAEIIKWNDNKNFDLEKTVSDYKRLINISINKSTLSLGVTDSNYAREIIFRLEEHKRYLQGINIPVITNYIDNILSMYPITEKTANIIEIPDEYRGRIYTIRISMPIEIQHNIDILRLFFGETELNGELDNQGFKTFKNIEINDDLQIIYEEEIDQKYIKNIAILVTEQ